MMKQWFRKTTAVVLSLVLLVSAGGCSALFKKSYTFSEAEDTLFISSNGMITDSIVSSFDKDYYSIEELTGIAQKMVLDFNQKNYNYAYYTYDQMPKEDQESRLLPVSFESIKKANDTVTIVFSYANGDTYTRFNLNDIQAQGGTRVYTNLVSRAITAGEIPSSMNFVSADGQKTITGADLEEYPNYIVCYADFPVNIYGEHEVAFVSTNVAVQAENGVTFGSTDGAYVIFK